MKRPFFGSHLYGRSKDTSTNEFGTLVLHFLASCTLCITRTTAYAITRLLQAPVRQIRFEAEFWPTMHETIQRQRASGTGIHSDFYEAFAGALADLTNWQCCASILQSTHLRPTQIGELHAWEHLVVPL